MRLVYALALLAVAIPASAQDCPGGIPNDEPLASHTRLAEGVRLSLRSASDAGPQDPYFRMAYASYGAGVSLLYTLISVRELARAAPPDVAQREMGLIAETHGSLFRLWGRLLTIQGGRYPPTNSVGGSFLLAGDAFEQAATLLLSCDGD